MEIPVIFHKIPYIDIINNNFNLFKQINSGWKSEVALGSRIITTSRPSANLSAVNSEVSAVLYGSDPKVHVPVTPSFE